MNLIKSLIARVLSLLGLKDMSVDGAVASFKKAVAKLEAVVEHHSALETEHLNAAAEHNTLANEAQREALRARSIADRLSDLVGE